MVGKKEILGRISSYKIMKYTKETIKQSRINVKNAEEIVARLEEGTGVFETVTLWMDLLGFRSHLDKENWNLQSENARLGMRRIAALHEVALLSMNDRYEVVQLNDAIVISQDISKTNFSKSISEFLELVDYHYEVAVLTDYKIGGCGIRGVVAKGLRYNLRGNLGWTPTKTDCKKPSFFCPRPVMMNTAFGRSYGVESSHKLEKGNGLYVEESLLFSYGATIMETWDLTNSLNIDHFGKFYLVRNDNL